jgi:hypothetical protein
MYKEALITGMRVQTPKGNLSTEQLFSLNVTELNDLAVALDEAYEKSKGKSFLETRTTKDKGIKLQFDIVLDILRTKLEASSEATRIKEAKENNAKILAIIEKKTGEAMEEKSIAELKKLLVKI